MIASLAASVGLSGQMFLGVGLVVAYAGAWGCAWISGACRPDEGEVGRHV